MGKIIFDSSYMENHIMSNLKTSKEMLQKGYETYYSGKYENKILITLGQNAVIEELETSMNNIYSTMGYFLGENLKKLIDEFDKTGNWVESFYSEMCNYKPDIELPARSQLYFGLSIGQYIPFDVTNSYLTVYDAMNGGKSVDVYTNIVNKENTVVDSFWYKNEQGIMTQIEVTPGLSIEAAAASVDVRPEDIVIKLTDKDGNPHAWINYDMLSISSETTTSATSDETNKPADSAKSWLIPDGADYSKYSYHELAMHLASGGTILAQFYLDNPDFLDSEEYKAFKNGTLKPTTNISSGDIRTAYDTSYDNIYLSNNQRNKTIGDARIVRPSKNRQELSGTGYMTEEDWIGYEYLKPSIRCTGHDTDVSSSCTCNGGFDKVSRSMIKSVDDMVTVAEEKGWTLSITSGYRCEDRADEVNRTSSTGSKHHTGYAVDMAAVDKNGNSISTQELYNELIKIEGCDYNSSTAYNQSYTYIGSDGFVHFQTKDVK